MRSLILGLLLVVGLEAKDIYATLSIYASQKADLAFNSSGIVDKVLVDVSSEVTKGDILATLQNDDLKALLEIAKTALKYAKNDYDRQVKVRHIIDKARFDQYAFKYQNAKSKFKYQKALLDKTILKAPFNGTIYVKSTELGDVVSGQMIKTAFKIQSSTSRKVILEFDQKYWKSVKIGQKYKYQVDGDDKTYTTTITKIYPYVDGKNQKIKAQADAKGLMVGLFGDGYISVD